ncbi:MAG: hypothetical protein ACRBN8_40855 [Nannocystales bacterium]
MLNQTHFLLPLLAVIALGCPASSENAGDSETEGTTTPQDNPSTATSSTGEESSSVETNPSSSTDSPVDPCPPGVGVDWPRQGAFLKLANEEDFTVGPHDVSCSIDRALDSTELNSLLPFGTAGALQFTCELPDGGGSSVIYLGVVLPEAVVDLEALVGLQDVSVLFQYGGPLRGKLDPGTDTLVFAVRDESGPLVISQLLTCDGPILLPDIACGFFLPPLMVSQTWSDPLPEPRLAPAGCGTRAWAYDQAPGAGIYEMSRLAVRFETEAGVVDALDHHVTPLDFEGDTYSFFAIEAVGELEDPTVFASDGYNMSVRFLIIRVLERAV